MTTALFFLVLVAFFITGMPVVFAIGITPVILMIIQEGSLSINMSIIAQKMYGGINSFLILSIPFFFLAGRLMNEGGMTDKIYGFCNNFIKVVIIVDTFRNMFSFNINIKK